VGKGGGQRLAAHSGSFHCVASKGTSAQIVLADLCGASRIVYLYSIPSKDHPRNGRNV
jgi:hypothetical protein